MLFHALTYNIHGLPWVPTNLNRILYWLLEIRVPVICFQEVFTQRDRALISTILGRNGYTVRVPHDEGVSLFPSGLVTAVLNSVYEVQESSFRPVLTSPNVEIFANKGFHRIALQCRVSNRRFHVINTHTQSDEEVLCWTRYAFKKSIRYQQAAQMIEYCTELTEPVLVVGDFNQESSLHPNLRTLYAESALPIRKATFFRTGEDLDHVAWMPLQWSKAGCGFCGKYGPTLELCKVHEVDWSDHAPVEVKVRIPEYPT